MTSGGSAGLNPTPLRRTASSSSARNAAELAGRHRHVDLVRDTHGGDRVGQPFTVGPQVRHVASILRDRGVIGERNGRRAG